MNSILTVQLRDNKLRRSLNWDYFTGYFIPFTDHQEQVSFANGCKIDLHKMKIQVIDFSFSPIYFFPLKKHGSKVHFHGIL